MDVIRYAFNTVGVGDKDYVFQPNVEFVTLAEVKIEKDQVLMNLQVKNVFHGDDLTEFDEFFLNWSVSFGFEFGVPVRELRNCGHTLPKREGSRTHQDNVGPLTFPLPNEPVYPDDERLEKVLRISSCVNNDNFSYLRQFAFANSESDSISRFSFLYNSMMQMAGDLQAD